MKGFQDGFQKPGFQDLSLPFPGILGTLIDDALDLNVMSFVTLTDFPFDSYSIEDVPVVVTVPMILPGGGQSRRPFVDYRQLVRLRKLQDDEEILLLIE